MYNTENTYNKLSTQLYDMQNGARCSTFPHTVNLAYLIIFTLESVAHLCGIIYLEKSCVTT